MAPSTTPSMAPSAAKTLRRMTQTARIIHLALLMSIVIYVVVLNVVVANPEAPAGQSWQDVQPIFMALSVAAVAMLGVMVFLRGKMMPARKPPAHIDDRVSDGPISEASRAALARLFAASILSWALTEAVCLFGFVLGFLLHDPQPMYPFAFVALVTMLLLTPRRAHYESVVRAADAQALAKREDPGP